MTFLLLSSDVTMEITSLNTAISFFPKSKFILDHTPGSVLPKIYMHNFFVQTSWDRLRILCNP